MSTNLGGGALTAIRIVDWAGVAKPQLDFAFSLTPLGFATNLFSGFLSAATSAPSVSRRTVGSLHMNATFKDSATPALRSFNKDVRRLVRDIEADVARHVVLPHAKTIAPSVVRASLATGATMRGAWLGTTARGQKRAIVGLLNWGGTVRTPIIPKKRMAVRFPVGSRYIFASRIDTPRHYKGQHFMEKAVDRALPEFTRRLERDLTRELQRRLDASARRMRL